MGQYWTRKNDQEDLDAEKTANPWAEHMVKGDRNIPDRAPTPYEEYCQMMAQQQEDEIDEIIMVDEQLRECSPEGSDLQNKENQLITEISHGVNKDYQPEGVFVRGH